MLEETGQVVARGEGRVEVVEEVGELHKEFYETLEVQGGHKQVRCRVIVRFFLKDLLVDRAEHLHDSFLRHL
jgi:hypothetical protein